MSPTRREFLQHSALAAIGLAVAPSDGAARLRRRPPWPGYDAAIVIDALGGPGPPGFREGGGLSDATLAAVRRSGVTAVNLTVGVVGDGPDRFEATEADLDFWDRQIAARPDDLLLVRTAADIAKAKASNRLGIVYGFQDAIALDGRLDRLDHFRDRGVRIIQLTYNRTNRLGDGSMETRNGGLTEFGREVVARMNEVNLLVDLSHCGQRTTAEGIAASEAPVAITHSGCAALADLPRNKTDADLRSLADRGGVVGIYFMPFLREEGQPMASDVVVHIEHAWDVCGEDHVGIGTDGGIPAIAFDEEFRRRHREDVRQRRARGISAPGEMEDVYTFIPDLNDDRRLDLLADVLSARGHTDGRIEKLLGANFRRLFEEVWGG